MQARAVESAATFAVAERVLIFHLKFEDLGLLLVNFFHFLLVGLFTVWLEVIELVAHIAHALRIVGVLDALF